MPCSLFRPQGRGPLPPNETQADYRCLRCLARSVWLLCDPASKWRALADRRRQRALVEIIELAADRYAVRKPGDLDLGPMQQIGDVMGSGLPIDRGIEGEDHLLDGGVVD